jgi:uncharacterized protein YkwD
MNISKIAREGRYLETVGILESICRNILKDKNNPKFRRINENAKKFKELITPEIINVLLDLGFTQVDDHLCWMFGEGELESRTHWIRLESFHNYLNDATSHSGHMTERISREELARITEERLTRPMNSSRQTLNLPNQPPPRPVTLNRRAKFISLSDLEDKRKVPTHFAEEYYIKNRVEDLEYLGRLAVDMTNKFRVEHGNLPVAWCPYVYDVTSKHAHAMASGDEAFSHDNFDRRVTLIRASVGQIHGSGENIAYNQGTSKVAETAVEGWIASEGHRQNLIGEYSHCAVGVAMTAYGVYYLSQIFYSK